MLNWGDRKSILLTIIVGASLILPVNQFTTRANFYEVCALFEYLVLLLAIRIDTRATNFIVTMCCMLIGYHLIGSIYGGHPPDSPYRLLVKIAEYAEITACILFANPTMRLLKNDARRYQSR